MKTFGSVSIGIAACVVAILESPSERPAPPVECRHQGNIERSRLALALAVLAGRGVGHARSPRVQRDPRRSTVGTAAFRLNRADSLAICMARVR